MAKSPDAFRTISEVADWLGVPTHVLRFWESRFTQVKPVKRAGGRRYYRPADMELIGGIKRLLHDDGMTIRGVQKLLREQGVKHVSGMSQPLFDDSGEVIEATVEVEETTEPAEANVVAFGSSRTPPVVDPAENAEDATDFAASESAEPNAAPDAEDATPPPDDAKLAPVPDSTPPEEDPGGLIDLMSEDTPPPEVEKTPETTVEDPVPQAAEASEPAPVPAPRPLGTDIPEDGEEDDLEPTGHGTATRVLLADRARLAANADTLAIAHARLVALRDRMDARR